MERGCDGEVSGPTTNDGALTEAIALAPWNPRHI